MTADDRTINVYELGTTRYGDVHQLQRRLQQQRHERKGADSLLLTEHRPVLTLGRAHPTADLRVPAGDLERYGIEIVQTERGGDITYHGPGQLVAYGIIHSRPTRDQAPTRSAIGIVELDEGPWLHAHIATEDPGVGIGSRVEVAFERADGGEAVPVFKPT